jgi:UrcA family protein
MCCQNNPRPLRVIGALTVLVYTFGSRFVTAAPPTNNLGSSTIVRFSDLNLASEKDVATVYHRIKMAARLVCWNEIFMSAPSRERELKRCIDETVDTAIGDVNRRPLLTALHRSKAAHATG